MKTPGERTMTDWPSIIGEHGASVWRTVYRLLDHHADACECYQETFLTAWRLAEREAVVDWRAFLVRLATRRAIDRLRQRIRRRRNQVPLDNVSEPAAAANGPLQQAGTAELMDHVRAGMAQLPGQQAEVFWLSCIEGHSHQQIGDQMGITPGNVRVLLHRAREALATRLKPKLLDESERR